MSLCDAHDAARDLTSGRADWLLCTTVNVDIISVNVGPTNRRTKERAEHEARMALVRTIARDLDEVTVEPTLAVYDESFPQNNAGCYMGQGLFRGVTVIVTTPLNRDEVDMATAGVSA